MLYTNTMLCYACKCGHCASWVLDTVQLRGKIKFKHRHRAILVWMGSVFKGIMFCSVMSEANVFSYFFFPCHPDHSMSWVVFREPFLTFGIGPGCLALSLGMCVAGDYCLNESLSKRNKSVYFILILPETNSAFTRPSAFNFLKYCTCIDFTFHIFPISFSS